MSTSTSVRSLLRGTVGRGFIPIISSRGGFVKVVAEGDVVRCYCRGVGGLSRPC